MQQSTTKQLRTTTATVSYNPLGTYKTAARRHKFRKLKLQGLDFFFFNSKRPGSNTNWIPLHKHFTVSFRQYNSCVCPFFSYDKLHPLTGQHSVKFTIMKQSQCWQDPIVMCACVSRGKYHVREWRRSRLESCGHIVLDFLFIMFWRLLEYFSLKQINVVLQIRLQSNIQLMSLNTLKRTNRRHRHCSVSCSDIKWQWTIDDSEQFGGNFPSAVSHHFCFLWLYYVPQISSKLPYFVKCSCFF